MRIGRFTLRSLETFFFAWRLSSPWQASAFSQDGVFGEFRSRELHQTPLGNPLCRSAVTAWEPYRACVPFFNMFAAMLCRRNRIFCAVTAYNAAVSQVLYENQQKRGKALTGNSDKRHQCCWQCGQAQSDDTGSQAKREQ